MVAQRGQQPRVQLLDPLERDPARLARERDQAEVAGGHHRQLGQLRRRRASSSLGVRASRPSRRGRGPRAATVSSRASSVRPAPEVGGGVVLAPVVAVHDVAGLAGRADDVLERHPVALEERRALGLAVVGEHHQPVGARRRPPAAAATRAIWRSTLAQHRQRVGALDARSGGPPRRRRGTSCRPRAARRACPPPPPPPAGRAGSPSRRRASPRTRARGGCAAGRRGGAGSRCARRSRAISATTTEQRLAPRRTAGRSRPSSRGRSAAAGAAPCSS